MEFKHFLGNEKIKAQLSALVDGGRLPHAVVLEGESGLGKRTLAGELAAALAVSYTHLDVYKRQGLLTVGAQNAGHSLCL